MDPTLVPGIWFESQFHICVYEHAILRIYIIILHNYDLAYREHNYAKHCRN